MINTQHGIDAAYIQHEEFVQNCLQYRWLDETRSKLIDRVFILTAALFVARFQFSEFFLKNPEWLYLLYVVFIVASIAFAYSIVRFRRQQRGHAEYIKVCRGPLIENNEALERYAAFLGTSLYLTKGVEAAVVAIATLAPVVLILEHEAFRSSGISKTVSGIGVFVLPIIFCVFAICSIAIPYVKYNFKKTLDWTSE